MPDLVNYYKSLSKELFSSYNRVRDLVNHYPEDGRYKEILLRKMIQKFLPKDFAVGTGFVATRGFRRENEFRQTSQIDIIIYNTKHPVLFSEGDFVVVLPQAVGGIIEVKTNIKNSNIQETIKKSNDIGSFIMSNKIGGSIFNGIFNYEGFSSLENFKEYINRNQQLNYINENYGIGGAGDDIHTDGQVTHVVFNDRFFMKNRGVNDIRYYDMKDLAFIFFVSNLLQSIRDNVLIEKALRFPTDKELNKINFN